MAEREPSKLGVAGSIPVSRLKTPGARAVLARFAPCEPTHARLPPRAPDPVGWRDRSRGQPPAHVAQAAEHFHGKEEVTGSNPVVGLGTGRARCAI